MDKLKQKTVVEQYRIYGGTQLTTFAQTTPTPHFLKNVVVWVHTTTFFKKCGVVWLWCWCGLGEGCPLYATVRIHRLTNYISPTKSDINTKTDGQFFLKLRKLYYK